MRQNAERGEKITPAALAMVKGTSLDTGALILAGDKARDTCLQNAYTPLLAAVVAASNFSLSL